MDQGSDLGSKTNKRRKYKSRHISEACPDRLAYLSILRGFLTGGYTNFLKISLKQQVFPRIHR